MTAATAAKSPPARACHLHTVISQQRGRREGERQWEWRCFVGAAPLSTSLSQRSPDLGQVRVVLLDARIQRPPRSRAERPGKGQSDAGHGRVIAVDCFPFLVSINDDRPCYDHPDTLVVFISGEGEGPTCSS